MAATEGAPATQGSPSTRIPWTITALIVIWVVVEAADFFSNRTEGLPGGNLLTIAQVIQFVYAYLLIALIGHGLIRRVRFAWLIALAWQVLRIALGVINQLLNDYALSFAGLSGIPLWGIAVPIIVGVISLVLLLLPITQSWVRTD